MKKKAQNRGYQDRGLQGKHKALEIEAAADYQKTETEEKESVNLVEDNNDVQGFASAPELHQGKAEEA